MIQSEKPAEMAIKGVVNWEKGTTPAVFNSIHDRNINIAIYERDVNGYRAEVNTLLEKGVEFRSKGSLETIVRDVEETLGAAGQYLLIQDIRELLQHFDGVANARSYRVLLTVVENNMCSRFHTDLNDLRMLCTYNGPGTLWLTEDNVNREAMKAGGDKEKIVIDESKIQQTDTGAVVILKGAIYPKEGTRAVVHRSPAIEHKDEKRLLLRIDTNEFLNFDL